MPNAARCIAELGGGEHLLAVNDRSPSHTTSTIYRDVYRGMNELSLAASWSIHDAALWRTKWHLPADSVPIDATISMECRIVKLVVCRGLEGTDVDLELLAIKGPHHFHDASVGCIELDFKGSKTFPELALGFNASQRAVGGDANCDRNVVHFIGLDRTRQGRDQKYA